MQFHRQEREHESYEEEMVFYDMQFGEQSSSTLSQIPKLQCTITTGCYTQPSILFPASTMACIGSYSAIHYSEY